MGKPKQVTLILSGGGDPSGNNYSQYLQTLRVSDFLKSREDVEATTLFGSGLNERSRTSATPDVAKKDSFDGDPHFIPGIIRGNRPATREEVEKYFKETLASRHWQNGDRFFLFVSDHGNKNYYNPMDVQIVDGEVTTAYQDNYIKLWDPNQTLYPERGNLTVTDLKKLLQKSLPDNVGTTFVMTQCFSGGFHMLGYMIDEKGVPKKEGNICGFTAITQDTTASGCTAFVSEHQYDGYERRIAEAMTDVGVLDGNRLNSPLAGPWLSQAHMTAMLNDNTKDVPLRTSEAYILQYLEAERRKRKEAEKDKPEEKLPSLDEELEKIWDEIEEESKKATVVEIRFGMVRALAKKMEEWHPEHMYRIANVGLKGISARRKAIQILQTAVDEERDGLQNKYDKKFEPIRAAYLLALKEKENPEAKQAQEWERLMRLDDARLVYSRLFLEDPTLKKYTQYLAYENNRDDIILESGVEAKEISTLLSLRPQMGTLKREAGRLGTLEGQFRRIETQMQVAAGVVWLTRQNRQEVLEDYNAFVACENAAKIPD